MSNHHDAVTGTCHQVVANDYAARIDAALKYSRKVGSFVVLNRAREDIGIDVRDFEYCDRSNGTYLNCPIRNISDEGEWFIA